MDEVHCGRGAVGLDDKKLLLVSVPHEKLLLVSVPHEKLLLVSVSACVRIIFCSARGGRGGEQGLQHCMCVEQLEDVAAFLGRALPP